MIKFELTDEKQLKTVQKHSVFVGENNFDVIYISLVTDKISGHNVSDCDFTAYIVLPDQTYFEYELEWDESASAEIPISRDLTGAEQKLKLYIEITAENNLIGKTNSAELSVEHIVNAALRIVTREELIAIIENILTGKLDNSDGSVKRANIDDGAVNLSKLSSLVVDTINERMIYNSALDGDMVGLDYLNTCTSSKTVYDVYLFSNTIYSGQPMHMSARITNIGDDQIALLGNGKTYTRYHNTTSDTWTDFEEA